MIRKYSALLTSIYARVAKRTGLKRKEVRLIHEGFWRYMQHCMELYDFDLSRDDITWDEFREGGRCKFNLPAMGYLYVNHYRYKRYYGDKDREKAYKAQNKHLVAKVESVNIEENKKEEKL